jgi:hypothetical protein
MASRNLQGYQGKMINAAANVSVNYMAKRKTSNKKEPHRMVPSKPESNQRNPQSDFEAQVDSFARKVHGVIQEARSKMTDENVEKADQAAQAILKAATSPAKRARRSA